MKYINQFTGASWDLILKEFLSLTRNKWKHDCTTGLIVDQVFHTKETLESDLHTFLLTHTLSDPRLSL